MIYLDCAATSLQKPQTVYRAVQQAMVSCTSPGRGTHPLSERAAQLLFRCRETAAAMFGADGPEQVVFTTSATHGLNIAIRSLIQPGSRVVISGYEHNAVTRTLADIPEVDVAVAVGRRLFDPESDAEAFEALIDETVTAVICTHVSNVFGYILPIERIAKCCREKKIPLIVDASQSAGVLPVSLNEWGAAYVAMPGHKGLCGPQGTGLLIVGKDQVPRPLMTGGTGSESALQQMPEYLPDRLEAGTHNVPGIAGMLAGMRFIQNRGTEQILKHERMLAGELKELLRRVPEAEVFGSERLEQSTGVVSIRFAGRDCEETAEKLAGKGFALRAGLHCAPLAHQTAGTLETGTIRVSVSPFTTEREIKAFVYAVWELMQK